MDRYQELLVPGSRLRVTFTLKSRLILIGGWRSLLTNLRQIQIQSQNQSQVWSWVQSRSMVSLIGRRMMGFPFETFRSGLGLISSSDPEAHRICSWRRG